MPNPSIGDIVRNLKKLYLIINASASSEFLNKINIMCSNGRTFVNVFKSIYKYLITFYG